MTSTNINIGLSEAKSSSRVLKPPGGGHSDIFGIREGNEIQTPNKRRNHPTSTINSCFMHQEFTKSNDIKPETKEISDIENGNENIKTEDVTDENTEPKEADQVDNKIEEKEAAVPTRRGRVPPGGFSSALW